MSKTCKSSLIGESNDDGYWDIVIVTVKDNGDGLDEKIIPQLFTKFVSKSFQGTGLGLYICKNIIEAHGGKIWAKNNEDRKGVTFGFSLSLDKQYPNLSI